MIVQDELIGRDKVLCRPVEFFVRAVLVVDELDLPAPFDGGVRDFDVVEYGAVVSLAPFVDGPDVLDVRAEMPVRERAQLFDELLRVARGDILARQHAVDEHPELRVVELPRREIAAAAVGLYVVSRLLQQGQIAPDRLALQLDAVVSCKARRDVVLRQRVIGTGVLLQYLQYAQKREFFGFQRLFHIRSPPRALRLPPQEYHVAPTKSIRAYHLPSSDFTNLS